MARKQYTFQLLYCFVMFSSVAWFICFYCSAFCDTSSHNITSVYVFNSLHKSKTQIREHHELSDICSYMYIAYLKQISEFEPVLTLTVIVLFFFTMKYLLLKPNNQASYQTEAFSFTIHTPMTSTFIHTKLPVLDS